MKLQFAVLNDAAIAIVNIAAVAVVIQTVSKAYIPPAVAIRGYNSLFIGKINGQIKGLIIII